MSIELPPGHLLSGQNVKVDNGASADWHWTRHISILNGGYADEAASGNTFEVLAGSISVIAPSALGASSGETLLVTSTISGSALLTINGGADNNTDTGMVVFNAANNYTGGLTVSAGTLQTIANNTLSASSALSFNGNSALNLAGTTSQAILGLTGTTNNTWNIQNIGAGQTLNISSSASTAVMNLNNSTTCQTTSGVRGASGSASGNFTVGGTMALTKIGSGTLSLSGPNTYTGATTISAGTLALSNAGGNNIAASQTINVSSGATLNVMALNGSAITLGTAQTLQGFGTVNGGVAINGSGSTVSGGSAGSIGTLTIGNLDLSAGGNIGLLLGTAGTSATSPGVGSLISVNGNVTLPSTQIGGLTITDNHGANGQGSLGNGYYDLLNCAEFLNGSYPGTSPRAGNIYHAIGIAAIAGLAMRRKVFSFQ